MHAAAQWKIDQTKILNQAEIAAVLSDLKRKARRSVTGLGA